MGYYLSKEFIFLFFWHAEYNKMLSLWDFTPFLFQGQKIGKSDAFMGLGIGKMIKCFGTQKIIKTPSTAQYYISLLSGIWNIV